MPLIVLSGYPSSGKTRRAQQLHSYFSSKISPPNPTDNNGPNAPPQSPTSEPPTPAQLSTPSSNAKPHRPLKIIHISENSLSSVPRSTLYNSARLEKDSRAAFLSAIKRSLSKDTIVIADGLNYIKGYRYQLYCEAKAVGTTSCVVHVGSSVESCRGWNEERSERGRTVGGQDLHPQTDGDEVGEDGKDGEVVVDDTGGCYEEEVLNQLIQRYEEPNGMNRWDAPLFTILEEDADVPGEKIWQVLFGNSSEGGGGKGKGGVVVKPHAATVLHPASQSNYLYDLDQTTQSIVTAVLEWQKTHEGEASGEVSTPYGSVELPGRSISLPQLQRLRRQFITLNRQHQLLKGRIGGAFVEYLNDGLG